MGSAKENEVVLPPPAPPQVGVVLFAKGVVSYGAKELKPNSDIITVGRVKFFVIKRGEEFFIRVKDNDSQLRREFSGLKWFPVDPAWKVTAQYTPYETPHTIKLDSQNGVKQTAEVPGYVTFQRDGKEYRLEPVKEAAELFFIIRDATSKQIHLWSSSFPLCRAGERGWHGDSGFQ